MHLSNIGVLVITVYQVNIIYAVLFCFLVQLWITGLKIIMSGDTEVNWGPKHNFCQNQSFQSLIGT